ncbi:MAG: putative DNA binding domain-containing protein [Roseovarius sp.]|nr:putative DNA binding domain-containing protein [Roseovarius sp.]
MFATRSELLKKIERGEDTFLECKEVTFKSGNIREPKQDKLADEIAAFANTCGGVIVLGVRDRPRDVVGIPVERLDAVEALVRQACEDSMEPSGAPVIERMYLQDGIGEEKPIVRVEISRSLFVHSSPGGYFHRIGSSKRKIPTEQLFRLFQQRTQARIARFDETPVSTATFDDLSEDLWKRFATPRTSDTQEQFLSKLGMASQDDSGTWRPSVAGILLASRKPQRFLPGAFIQAVAYRGTEISAGPGYQLDAVDITGPLEQQIIEACMFVRRNMRVEAKKETGGRVDIPQYDLLAVFEAIVNSIAHRDYSMPGSKIRLRLFDDRLELYTPGSLMNSMTTQSLRHRQASRNEAITSQLARCPVEHDDFAAHRTHIMDKRGEGVPVILSNSEQLSGRLPEYRMIDDSELLLTIYAASGS